MTRSWLIGLSVVCCGFGLLAIKGHDSARTVGLLVNGVLAVALAILTARDLQRRRVRLAPLIGVSYVIAPLVGLVLYAIFSARPQIPPNAAG